jgi:hypothetical protein
LLSIRSECTESLVLGTIDPDTEIYIYVKNISNGYVHRQEITSDAEGEITLDLTAPDPTFYNSDSSYEVWATLRTDSVKLDILYAYGLVDTCLSISFFRVNDTTEEAE